MVWMDACMIENLGQVATKKKGRGEKRCDALFLLWRINGREKRCTICLLHVIDSRNISLFMAIVSKPLACVDLGDDSSSLQQSERPWAESRQTYCVVLLYVHRFHLLRKLQKPTVWRLAMPRAVAICDMKPFL